MPTIATREYPIDERVESDRDDRLAVLGEVVRHTDCTSEEVWIRWWVEWELRYDDMFRMFPEIIFVSPGIDDTYQDGSIDIFGEYREHFPFATRESLDEYFGIFSMDFSQF